MRLIPPVYVKPFVKRQKNDAADAEAIVKAALRPTMRFVAVMTVDQQARAMLFRTRQMFVGQRTQLVNALRGHLAEHGLVAATGTAQLKHTTVEDRHCGCRGQKRGPASFKIPRSRDLAKLERIPPPKPRRDKMHCVELLGQRLMARDFDRQVAEVQVSIAVMNGYTALCILTTEAVG